MTDLRVTLVQADTIWHDPEANRARIAASLREGASDLIVLPETFTTGFSNEAVATAEGMDGPTVAWMRALAREHDAAITGSVQIRAAAAEREGVFNRLLFVTPDGAVRTYDKRHLFRMAGEHERYAAGRDRVIVEWRGWRICPLVCYDLRFPVFSRNVRFDEGESESSTSASVSAGVSATANARSGPPSLAYDLLLYVANWPAPRHDVWRTLLRARAMENLTYVVGVNRVGTDGNGHPYVGGSAAIEPRGAVLTECDDQPVVVPVTLDRALLDEHRTRFPAYWDADRFTLDG